MTQNNSEGLREELRNIIGFSPERNKEVDEIIKLLESKWLLNASLKQVQKPIPICPDCGNSDEIRISPHNTMDIPGATNLFPGATIDLKLKKA